MDNRNYATRSPHWTRPGKEGQVISVWCYTNTDSVELIINDKSLGFRQFNVSTLHLSWNVPYSPGLLSLEALEGGTQVLTKEVYTAKDAYALEAVSIEEGEKLIDLTVQVIDSGGVVVPHATDEFKFEVEGPLALIATDNGDP